MPGSASFQAGIEFVEPCEREAYEIFHMFFPPHYYLAVLQSSDKRHANVTLPQ
jgi:hypothetical protein